jgi:hypothetical protein
VINIFLKQDSRILLTISNLANLKQLMIPRIVNQFETAYKCSMADDIQVSIFVFKKYIHQVH